MYQINSSRAELAEEFRSRVFGQHTPDLQYLLHLMRTPSTEPYHVLIVVEPFKRWRLALKQPGSRSAPELTEFEFTSLEEAEWHVFKIRWNTLTGSSLEG